MADRLGARKARNIAASGAQVVVLANAGCQLHVGRALREAGLGHLQLVHPIELLDMSYRGVRFEI
jgi:glycolate oxidase iron-sulfur subunit